MKTARFSDVVDQCGRPENHLLFTPPEKDRALQNAIRQHRVLTVHREHVGTRKDFGEVGFQAEAHAQYLVFPRSLQVFAGRRIVGIRYELLAEPPAAENPRRSSPRPAPATPAAPARRTTPPPARRPAAPPVVRRRGAARPPSQDSAKGSARSLTPEHEALAEAVRAALRDLEEGKVVAAHRRLQAALATSPPPAR